MGHCAPIRSHCRAGERVSCWSSWWWDPPWSLEGTRPGAHGSVGLAACVLSLCGRAGRCWVGAVAFPLPCAQLGLPLTGLGAPAQAAGPGAAEVKLRSPGGHWSSGEEKAGIRGGCRDDREQCPHRLAAHSHSPSPPPALGGAGLWAGSPQRPPLEQGNWHPCQRSCPSNSILQDGAFSHLPFSLRVYNHSIQLRSLLWCWRGTEQSTAFTWKLF